MPKAPRSNRRDRREVGVDTEAEPSPARREANKRPRKRAAVLTCCNCRNRKIRCDGGQPRCGICIAYNDACIYDRPPPMSQIMAMADQLAQLQQVVQGMDGVHRQADGAAASAVNDTSHHQPSPPQSRPGIGDTRISGGGGATSVEIASSSPSTTTPRAVATSIANVEGPLHEDDTYYDTTSAVHGPRDGRAHTQTSQLGAEHQFEFASDKTSPQSVVRPQVTIVPAPDRTQLALWEEQAVSNAAVLMSLPQETIRRLFATHWTWVHAVFIFVPRATFLRDLAVGGEYASPLLLTVLCLHSTRFTDYQLTEQLSVRARLLLGQEMFKPGSITLVQALLQYCAREFGRGSVSQAWLLGGMAFRTAIDIGVFSEPRGEQIDPDAVERSRIGRQLAWSCFLWDKLLSLYLGRSPSLFEPPDWDPELPQAAETDLWPPYPPGWGGEGFDYSPTPSHLLLCFANLCRLGVIINKVLLNVYGSRRTRNVLTFIQDTRKELQAWNDNLPDGLRVDEGVQRCPPPHIVTQQILYHTTTILLHRPFRGNDTCRTTCREAAVQVERLLLLLERDFGFSRFTYAMAYCTYTAATVVVQDTKDGVPGAQRRLNTYIRAMYAIRGSCPGIQRSIDIITSNIELPTPSAPGQPQAQFTVGAGGTPRTSHDAPMVGHDDELVASGRPAGHISAHAPVIMAEGAAQHQDRHLQPYHFEPMMPAFPYHDYNSSGSFQDPAGFAMGHGQTFSANPFSHLDSYPQSWFNFTDDMLNDFGI